MNETLKKALVVLLTAVAVLGFYVVGKVLGFDVGAEFAGEIAVAVVAWAVYLANKWFGLKVDFLDSQFTRDKVKDAILWAEGKAIEALKFDKLVLDGTEKLKYAIEKTVSTLGVSEAQAAELIDEYFAQTRPATEALWKSVADSAVKKIPKPKKK